MQIGLGEHFNYNKLLRFVMPSILMMIFTSIYSVVDGLFVSNMVGKTAFAAVNFVIPLTMGLAAIGFMIGTGGNAIVAKTLGEGDRKKANEYFSMMAYLCIICGIVLAAAGEAVLRPLMAAMGAQGQMLDDSVLYGRILLVALPFFMLQNMFQGFLVTAEKPKLGLCVIVVAGVANMVLDALFMAVFGWGIVGAAAATAISQVLGGVIPVFYFTAKNSSLLQLVKAKFSGKVILKACANGASEFMTNVAISLVNVIYNLQLLHIAGENGVAAYGTIMYVNFIFIAIFIGYSMGCAPLVGYNHGAQNYKELKNLFRKSLILIGVTGVALTGLTFLLASPLSQLFVGYDAELLEMTKHGMQLFLLAFLVNGFNVFGSAFFTALNNGLVSAIISFLRTLLFQVAAVFLLPLVLGLDGIWLAISVAEVLTLIIAITFFITQKKRYNY
jgi:putative MATE family efflux protein